MATNGKKASKASIAKALLALLLIIHSSCMQNTSEELHEVEEEIERASLSAYDLRTYVTDLGNYRYEFDTPELHQYDNVEEPYVDFPGGLTFRSYDNGGEVVKNKIRCNNAKYYKSKNLWELNNDVEIVTEKGDVLNTEQMYWDTQEHTVYSEKFVKIQSKNQLITGLGFESDDRMSRYEIKHPGGEIEVEE